MDTTDTSLLERQFLYQFATENDLKESYALNGGSTVSIGGSVSDFQSIMLNGDDDSAAFNNKPVPVSSKMIFPTPDKSIPFAPLFNLKGDGADLMLKIQDYVPPMKQELEQQVMTIDTWQRGTLLPDFFYEYFTDTFMIPAYTCD